MPFIVFICPAIFQGPSYVPSHQRMSPSHHSSSSCSRSSTSSPSRRHWSRSRSISSRSSSRDHLSRPYAADQQLLRLRDVSPVPQQEDEDVDLSSSPDDIGMSAEAVKKLFAYLVCPPALSHYADPFPDAYVTNNQLVPYVKDTAKSRIVCDTEELNTHDGLFQNYPPFQCLSGEQDHEARTLAYHDLMNLMLSQTTEDKHLINVSTSHPKAEGPFHSHLENKPEFKKKQHKLHLQWPPIKETNRVVNRTLGLYQHGPLPKTGSSSPWFPPTVENLWEKEFSPKEFPTTHKIPPRCPNVGSYMRAHPWCWNILLPRRSTRYQMRRSQNAPPGWGHLQQILPTQQLSLRHQWRLCITFCRKASCSSGHQLPRIYSKMTFNAWMSFYSGQTPLLEAQLMSYDARITATELYIHLHMLWCRTVLDSPSVDLPHRDKDRLMVMSLGGQDLFGPNAWKVQEWRKDTDEEQVKMISGVFHERQNRDKATWKKPSSSSSVRPPRSLSHQLPLDSLHPPKSKDSYQRPPGHSFRGGSFRFCLTSHARQNCSLNFLK